MNIQYNIKIQIIPELGKKKNMHFWCVEKNVDGKESNCGHGWSDTIQMAANDAYDFYTKRFCINE